MAINLLEIEPNKVPTSPEEYSTFIYGPPKIGKTTLAYDMFKDRGLFIATEDRHKALPGAMIQRVTNWAEFLNVLAQLKNQQVKDKYDVVIIDTAENLTRMLEKYIASKWKEKTIGERSDIWGADWTDLKTTWKDSIQKISDFGYIPVFIGHATQKTIQIPVSGVIQDDLENTTVERKTVKDKKTGEESDVYEFEKFVPDLHDRYMAPINKMVDNILFLNTTLDSTSGQERRVIYLRETLQWQAGSTFDNIQPIVDLSAESYRKAIKKAIGEIDEDSKEDRKVVKEKEEGPKYEDLMDQVKKYGKAFQKAEKLDRLNSISEEVFGLGNKMTDATEDQKELLSVALNKIEEKAKELNIELGE